jgi:hypothetical protein
MIELIIICTTITILFIIYLFAQANQIYVDEPVASGKVYNHQDKICGDWVRYKRTHKNGKVTYHEKKYTT